MPNNIIDIADLETLKELKTKIQNGSISTEKELFEFKSEYEDEILYDRYTCHINFGYDRKIDTFKKNIENMKPYSNVINFPKVRQAKGIWKNIYEIVFNSGDSKTMVAKIEKEEKVKQIIKEAA